jgi:hypothetical protein
MIFTSLNSLKFITWGGYRGNMKENLSILVTYGKDIGNCILKCLVSLNGCYVAAKWAWM